MALLVFPDDENGEKATCLQCAGDNDSDTHLQYSATATSGGNHQGVINLHIATHFISLCPTTTQAI